MLLQFPGAHLLKLRCSQKVFLVHPTLLFSYYWSRLIILINDSFKYFCAFLSSLVACANSYALYPPLVFIKCSYIGVGYAPGALGCATTSTVIISKSLTFPLPSSETF